VPCRARFITAPIPHESYEQAFLWRVGSSDPSAKSSYPAPTRQDVQIQLADHVLKVSELLAALSKAGETFSSRDRLELAQDVLSFAQRQLRSSNIEIALGELDRVALLDALCGQIVTAIGVATVLGMNIDDALQLVADTNATKSDEDGPHPDGQGVMTPDLAAFIDRGREQV